jgi:MoxR-like ATPase
MVTPARIGAMQQAVESIEANQAVIDYVVSIVEATRDNGALEIGASPRGGLALLRAARAKAALDGRGFATPDDVKSLAIAVLAHRLVLRTEAWVRGVREIDVVAECLAQVPTPATLTDRDVEVAIESAPQPARGPAPG